MASQVQRVRYFTGEFLTEADFNAEQSYHMRMRYLHNRWLHTWGIVNGLDVSAAGSAALEVTVKEGMALVRMFDGEEVAKELVLTNEIPVSLPSGVTAGSQYYIVASYAEQAVSSNGTEDTRWAEQPAISAVLVDPSSPPDNETTLILAKVVVNSGANGIADIDVRERRIAGVRGEVEATSVRLPVTNISDAAEWPILRGGAARRLDLAGSLKIIDGNLDLAGSLNVTAGNVTLPENATVDGRDVSADGISLDSHKTDMSLHVDNGNYHDHTGGHGAPIPWAALTGVPANVIKAFASVNCVPDVPTLMRSYNVDTVTRPGTGTQGAFTVTYATIVNPMFFLWVQAPEPTDQLIAYVTTSGPTTATFSVIEPDGTLVNPARLNILIL